MFAVDETDTGPILSVTRKSLGGPGSCWPSPVEGPKYLDVPFVEKQPEINRPVETEVSLQANARNFLQPDYVKCRC